MTTVEIVTLGVAAIVVAASEFGLIDWLQERRKQSPIERARDRYARGEITLDEFERIAARELPEVRNLRDELEAINGIGPETSASVVDHFASRSAIENADRDELENVYGVGPETADEIRERF